MQTSLSVFLNLSPQVLQKALIQVGFDSAAPVVRLSLKHLLELFQLMFKLQLLVLLDWSCKEPAFLCLLVYLLLLVFFLFLFGYQYRLCWLFVTYLFLIFALISFYEFKYFLESHVIANILLLIRILFRFHL